ncbi:hypothetical protein KOW79_012284 [Hemibagrus wyckioides]|uniref:Uncharacterized protein n=1 Tax=Hemibagrus wyckioides TaxID=337641 RepID=A0A9D3NN59_9TELE|nr:hypothetical protein KOW79_012284 [Hemibagrus wyckioides]
MRLIKHKHFYKQRGWRSFRLCNSQKLQRSCDVIKAAADDRGRKSVLVGEMKLTRLDGCSEANKCKGKRGKEKEASETPVKLQFSSCSVKVFGAVMSSRESRKQGVLPGCSEVPGIK